MRGFRNVEEVRAGDVLKAGPVEIEVTPAAHSGSRFTARAAAVGYMLRGSQTVYFAGDTDLFAGLEQIGGEGIDVALLPVWGWGPKVGKGHLDPTRAAEAARMLHPKLAVPIHWGTYGSSGGDVTRRPPEEFARLCACETRIVDPGERLVIDGYAADGPLEPSAA